MKPKAYVTMKACFFHSNDIASLTPYLLAFCVPRKARGTEGMKLVFGGNSQTFQRKVPFRLKVYTLIHNDDKTF